MNDIVYPGDAIMDPMPSRREFFALGFFPLFGFGRSASMAGAKFRIVREGFDRRRYIWLHGDEATAGAILREHIKKVGGRAFLIENNQRNITMENGGKLDPNRMFSRVGTEKSLRSLNPSWTAEQVTRTLDRIDRQRNRFLRKLLPNQDQVLIALHNNSSTYSVADEVAISDKIALNDKENPHEFLLCTFRADFDLLAGGPFNVVLQNQAPKEDDGSLSRLCAARRIRYVNIEAASGNAAGQTRMLNWAEAVLGD